MALRHALPAALAAALLLAATGCRNAANDDPADERMLPDRDAGPVGPVGPGTPRGIRSPIHPRPGQYSGVAPTPAHF